MPYKRPITDLNFNMALLLPAPTPAVVGSSYFSVVGVPLDVGLLAGPGMFFSLSCDFTATDNTSFVEPEQLLTNSMGCWDLAAMVQEGMFSFLSYILTTADDTFCRAGAGVEEFDGILGSRHDGRGRYATVLLSHL